MGVNPKTVHPFADHHVSAEQFIEQLNRSTNQKLEVEQFTQWLGTKASQPLTGYELHKLKQMREQLKSRRSKTSKSLLHVCIKTIADQHQLENSHHRLFVKDVLMNIAGHLAAKDRQQLSQASRYLYEIRKNILYPNIETTSELLTKQCKALPSYDPWCLFGNAWPIRLTLDNETMLEKAQITALLFPNAHIHLAITNPETLKIFLTRLPPTVRSIALDCPINFEALLIILSRDSLENLTIGEIKDTPEDVLERTHPPIRLKALTLSPGINIDERVIHFILRHSPQLESLDMQKHRLQNFENLPMLPDLVFVNFSESDINDGAMRQFLYICPNLRTIVLNKCVGITAKGFHALVWPVTVTSVYLLVTAFDVLALRNLTERCHNLKNIDFSYSFVWLESISDIPFPLDLTFTSFSQKCHFVELSSAERSLCGYSFPEVSGMNISFDLYLREHVQETRKKIYIFEPTQFRQKVFEFYNELKDQLPLFLQYFEKRVEARARYSERNSGSLSRGIYANLYNDLSKYLPHDTNPFEIYLASQNRPVESLHFLFHFNRMVHLLEHAELLIQEESPTFWGYSYSKEEHSDEKRCVLMLKFYEFLKKINLFITLNKIQAPEVLQGLYTALHVPSLMDLDKFLPPAVDCRQIKERTTSCFKVIDILIKELAWHKRWDKPIKQGSSRSKPFQDLVDELTEDFQALYLGLPQCRGKNLTKLV